MNKFVCSIVARLAVISPLIYGSAAAWGQSYVEVGTEAVFNVQDWGACPDDNVDDWAAVQDAVDDAKLYANGTTGACTGDPSIRRAVIFFPKGTYHFDSAVDLAGLYGMDIRGASEWLFGDFLSGFQGPGAKLVRRTGQPVFAAAGVSVLCFEHLLLHGGPAPKPGDPILGLIDVHSPAGLGTSHLTFKNMTFADAPLGLTTTTSGNNSEFIFERVNFSSVTTCFQPGSGQTLNHLFNMVTAVNCGTVFDLSRGGNVSVNIANIVNCNTDYIIKIGNLVSDGGGSNGGVNRFANMRIDYPLSDFKLLKICNFQKVEFDALNVNELAIPGDPPLANICRVENGSVTFNSCQFALTRVVECVDNTWTTLGYRRTIRFRDCHFLAEPEVGDTPPYSPCGMDFIYPLSPSVTAYLFDGCEFSYTGNIFVPLENCKYPASGSVPRW